MLFVIRTIGYAQTLNDTLNYTFTIGSTAKKIEPILMQLKKVSNDTIELQMSNGTSETFTLGADTIIDEKSVSYSMQSNNVNSAGHKQFLFISKTVKGNIIFNYFTMVAPPERYYSKFAP